MTAHTFTVIDGDGVTVHVDHYPASRPQALAVVHILHGWAEHAGRYAGVADQLAGEGFEVYADDHRGHGRTGLAAGSLGDLGPGGQDGAVWSAHEVTDAIADRHPDLPLFLLGHSWGSFIGQRILRLWADDLAGAVLMGTTYRVERSGPRRELNADFEPARTRYDWLSRDDAEVDAYIADPWCGFERLGGLPGSADPQPGRALPADGPVPTDLPVLILNGTADPVGGAAGGEALAASYREAGLADITLNLYDGARHELFNETNRGEVIADLVAWLTKRAG